MKLATMHEKGMAHEIAEERVRTLLLNDRPGNRLFLAVIGCVALLIRASVLAMQIYQKKLAR